MRKFPHQDDKEKFSKSKKPKTCENSILSDLAEINVNCNDSYVTNIFGALEYYCQLGSRKRHDRMFVIIEEKDCSSVQSYAIHENKISSTLDSSQKLTSVYEEIKKPSYSTKMNHACRHNIGGTGRVAFSGASLNTISKSQKDTNMDEPAEIRAIYRVNRSDKTIDEPMVWSDFIIGSPTSTPLHARDENTHFTISNATNLAGSLQAMTMSSSSSDVHNSLISKSESVVATNKFTGKPLNSGGSSISNMFKKSAAAAGTSASSHNRTQQTSNHKAPSGVKPTGSSIGNNSSSQMLGVGVGGRAAAMARMAVLGEEWAEEEELPGMPTHQSSNVSTTGSAATASVSREVGREVHNANQRNQKIKAAKRG